MSNIKPLLHTLVESLLIGFDGDIGERDTVFRNAEALGAALDEFAPVDQIDLIRPIPGDVIHLRMGDPKLGWIPDPETSEALAQAFRQALDDAGHDKVSLVWSHYGCRATVVRSEKAPADG